MSVRIERQMMLSSKQKDIIVQGDWLNDMHMDHFNQLLKNCSDYRPEGTWKIQFPQYIESVAENKKHIQILFSSNNHWVCAYYDRKNIFIYDSFNIKKLHKDHEQFLIHLFPFYSFDKRPIKFPIVQSQPNCSDCGVFAIAFAISLLFNIKPEKVRYDHSLMRSHLIKIFESNVIEHFPQDLNYDVPQKVFPLAVIKSREAEATRLRIIRRNKKNENECKNQGVTKTKIEEQMTLSLNQKDIIVRGDWLNDTHMDHFNQLLKNCSDYRPEGTWKIQLPQYIEPVAENKKHIQILFSSNNHWVCGYYDKKNLFIYDSLNKKKLHKDHEQFLRRLFLFYSFDKQPVKFPAVQNQLNCNDCGVFAIAFAISLLFNIKPEKVRYDHSLMRSHLIKIFESNVIEHFPERKNKTVRRKINEK